MVYLVKLLKKHNLINIIKTKKNTLYLEQKKIFTI